MNSHFAEHSLTAEGVFVAGSLQVVVSTEVVLVCVHSHSSNGGPVQSLTLPRLVLGVVLAGEAHERTVVFRERGDEELVSAVMRTSEQTTDSCRSGGHGGQWSVRMSS